MANKELLRGKLIAHAVAAWVVFFAFYLLFTGTGKPAELAVGGVSAGLVAAFDTALRARDERPLDLTRPMLWPLLPALGQLVLDTFRVAGALLAAFRAPPSGKFCALPRPAKTASEFPAAWGIAIAAASLAPDEFVVDARPEAGQLTVHRLVG
jgi:Na+/H+ ion antiporter subunit